MPFTYQPDPRHTGPSCPACGRHNVSGAEHAPTYLPGYSGPPCDGKPRKWVIPSQCSDRGCERGFGHAMIFLKEEPDSAVDQYRALSPQDQR